MDYTAEFFIEAKNRFEQYIESTRLLKATAWEIGSCSVVESVLTYLLLKVSEKSDDYYKLREKGVSIDHAVTELISGMMPSLLSDDSISEDIKLNDTTFYSWCHLLILHRKKLIFYIYSKSQFELILPFVSELNRPVLFISEYDFPEEIEVPDYVDVLILEHINACQFSNAFLERNFSDIFCYFSTFDIMLKILRPEGVVIVGEEYYQENILSTVCSVLEIPYICMRSIMSFDTSSNTYVDGAKCINETLLCDYLRCTERPRLHIGCGAVFFRDWLNVDISYTGGRIIYMDAGEHFPFPDDSFDAIFSEHMFEHLSVDRGINMLIESHRVLKKNGVIRLAIPCLEFLLDLYHHPESEINARYITWSIERFMPELTKLYPDKKYPAMFVLNNFYRDWGHQVIYDSKGITDMLIKCGFSNVKFCRQQESDYSFLRFLESHDKAIPKWAAELETTMIEACK